jgi:hypothetical protein
MVGRVRVAPYGNFGFGHPAFCTVAAESQPWM